MPLRRVEKNHTTHPSETSFVHVMAFSRSAAAAAHDPPPTRKRHSPASQLSPVPARASAMLPRPVPAPATPPATRRKSAPEKNPHLPRCQSIRAPCPSSPETAAPPSPSPLDEKNSRQI